jgi:hypothetical protein
LLRSGVTVPSAVSQLVSHIKQFVLLSDDASASQQRSPKIQGRALFEGLKGLEDTKVRELLEFGESVPRETPVDTCCELLVRRLLFVCCDVFLIKLDFFLAFSS